MYKLTTMTASLDIAVHCNIRANAAHNYPSRHVKVELEEEKISKEKSNEQNVISDR